ncbi:MULTISPECIES: hypothetical protein [Asticcacaulis]|uniref:hypothetical protein n=1 Tax=Asticcacaulis TaxID=76890 RepID=UPI001AE83831|nr:MULTISPECIES: hypothetical protein [Asticcacaulis]MBP2160465.1 hypothetical protein [Asticcacaulis solisilvae]MDR6801510.1 hypothetical protein [Asticcacaulis sp. BE141]
MIRLFSSSLSRLSAFAATLCVVALLLAGFSAVKADMMNLQHLGAGDMLLADGGWATNCVNESGDCTGHVSSGEPQIDLLALHHHHHSSGEAGPLFLSAAGKDLSALHSVKIVFSLGDDAPLPPGPPATTDQPPRA